MKAILGLLIVSSAYVLTASAGTNIVNCYLSGWAKWREGAGRFTIDDIDPMLCTHITYAFIGLTAAGDIDAMGSSDDFPSFIALKEKNPNVKLLISMGGWNEGSTVFSEVTNNDKLRATLVSNIFNYVTSNKFDGFDLDWEYPGQRGGAMSDRKTYVTFLKDLRAKFSGTNLIITSAVGGDIQVDDEISYDVIGMNKYLDYFNIMTYDYHGSWDHVTGENSPMYASSSDSDPNLNINASITGWIAAGANPQKVLLGVPFYGHSFILDNPSDHGIGAEMAGASPAGPYSEEDGTLEYLEICLALKQPGWTTVFDTEQLVPYSYKGNQWIGYDNAKSIKIKTDYAIKMNLAGVLIWSIESDDWNNACGDGKWPLLKTIDNTMKGGKTEEPTMDMDTTTTEPQTQSTTTSMMTSSTRRPPTTISMTRPTAFSTTTTTTTQTTSSLPGMPGTCSSSGFFPTPKNCATFYQCVSNGAGGFTKYQFNCPTSLAFNPKTLQCDYANNVSGCN